MALDSPKITRTISSNYLYCLMTEYKRETAAFSEFGDRFLGSGK